MEDTQPKTVPPQPDANQDDLPQGDHPIEIAARAGFGPMSPIGSKTWHGEAIPCVTCGQLARRDADVCPQCEQIISPTMIEKMTASAGPWYVLEHVRPFPGISLARLARQIRRGLITETSIIRGPATNHQWRFAVETPGICRYFNRCWQCHNSVSPSDLHCRACRAFLLFDQTHLDPIPQADSPSSSTSSVLVHQQSLHELSEAIHEANRSPAPALWDAPPRVGGISASWIVAGLLAIALIVLLIVTSARSDTIRTLPVEIQTSTDSTPEQVAPTPDVIPPAKQGVPSSSP